MKNKVVYIHRKKTDREVFYVGMGNPDRPYHKSNSERSKFWHRVVDKYGYDVEILHTGLTKRQAFDIEMDLIELIGRRDKTKGTLVNLTNGGDGANGNGTSCYNIKTGKIYGTIGQASEDIGMRPTTLVDMLSEKLQKKNTSPVRTFENPYPEDKLSEGTDYLEELTSYDSEYKGYPEFDDNEMALLNKIDSLPQDDVDILMMSYSMSVRHISYELGVGRSSVDRKLKKIREQILGDDTHLYNNKSLKQLKGSEMSKPTKPKPKKAKPKPKKAKCKPKKTSVNYFMEKMLKRQERYPKC